MAQHSSRLNRLLTLLDTGSTQTTRLAAARQIGDIAKSHPQDLNSLLKKVSQYLRSKNWDTRVAAAQAVGAIAENVKHTSVKELFACVEAEFSEGGFADILDDIVIACSEFDPDLVSRLSFRSFHINRVLDSGSPLLASGGQEYDIAIDSSKTPAERLVRQKQNLRRRLGLDVCEQFMDVNEMIKDEDLLVQRGPVIGNGLERKLYAPQSGQSIQQLVAKMVPSYYSRRLSRRELNMLKRKAKVNAKDHSKGWSEEDELESNSAQTSLKPRATYSDSFGDKKGVPDTCADEDNSENEGTSTWPFHSFVEQLIHDMFDPVWEIRHGTIMALREILTHQGASACVISDLNVEMSLLIDLELKDVTKSVKKEMEIDLNMEVDEYQAEKKRKLDEGIHLKDTEASSSIDVSCDAAPKTDLSACSTSSELPDGDAGILNVKKECDFSSNGLSPQQKDADGTTLLSSTEDIQPASKNDLWANLAENPKLMKLIRLARHSYIKNWEFLQDCAIRFLCVLSLDRFGDYVSDQVVAPVRETCAQALGAVLKYMHHSLVIQTLNVLLHMQYRQEWEIRHGCLLGIKYLVAVRHEMLKDLLYYILPACKSGLEDPDDDVRAVAAEALIPAAEAIVSLKGETLHSIVMLLWDILLNLDDLSPSTSSVMNLLAEIYTQPDMAPDKLGKLKTIDMEEVFDLNQLSGADDVGDVIKYEGDPYALSALTPRLWPFMRHSITSVRRSAIRTLEKLLEVGYRAEATKQSSFWLTSNLGDALRIVFQNLLMESDENILQSSERVWRLLLQCPQEDLESSAQLYFSSWMELATTPFGSPLDVSKMFCPVAPPRRSHYKAAAKMKGVKLDTDSTKESNLQEKTYDASINFKVVVGADSEKSVTHTRVVTSIALGVFASKLPESSRQIVVNPLRDGLTSLSGVQRQVASMVLIAWFKELKSSEPPGRHDSLLSYLDPLRQWLLDLLACSDPSFPTKDSRLPYSELSRTYSKMRNEAALLIRLIESSGMHKSLVMNGAGVTDAFTVDDAIELVSKLSTAIESSTSEPIDKQLVEDIESCKQQLFSTSGYLKCVQANLHITVSALAAAAVIWMSELPTKLNPVILPLMAAIKREQEEILQIKAAEALAELIFFCIDRRPSPNDKLLKNVCSLTCADSAETPQALLIGSMEAIVEQDLLFFGGGVVFQRGRIQTSASGDDRSKIEGYISRRGSELALKSLCAKFGSSLFEKLPKLWDCLTEIIKPMEETKIFSNGQYMVRLLHFVKDKDPQAMINNIQVVRSIVPMVDKTLESRLLGLLPCLLMCICHSHAAVKLAASRCITTMAKSMTTYVMREVIEKVIPMLGDSESVHARQGAGMLVSLLVQGLGDQLVPYASLLVVPLLRCMSDNDQAVRQCVTHSFAALVPLLPLSRGCPLPTGLSETLTRNTEDAKFLEQLLDNSHIEDYKLPFVLSVSLRRYQQEGINWLSFLRRFKLHGILCDDMGLGKTLQASAIIASDIVERRAVNNGKDPLSLVVCPSTLVGHWAYEVEKYIDSSIIITLQYVGSGPERASLREQFHNYNVIITSYDIVRKDIDYLGKFSWNYCVLDEGHIIKSARSKITCSVKQLRAEHRLILSGTPIQNNVLELWSLFDFLMPGFLGTERKFQATYGKPLLAAKDAKCSAKDTEAGILAMEALHKQVMPFLLRRTKDQVLSDLPEKIIQDRYCDLSPVQLKLYEQFSYSNAKKEITKLVDDTQNHTTVETSEMRKTTHVFQALQYLLKLCSHPLLAVGENPPDSIMCHLSSVIPGGPNISAELHELRHSPKLVALKEILEECGIGLDASGSEGSGTVGQHRVLVFAQHKFFLDIIEKDLFQTHMKSVTHLRLDGSVAPEKRFEIVKTFNSDPTIDVLLLTTHVGGLGLNLTSADTLVFMEHDWNPMKDHQAMDRAHRLGQRKVVNVHRLIMRGTLEEKVMSLQRFKVSVANSVINAENASLKTMNTDQLLDLFTSASTTRKGGVPASSSNGQDGDSKAKSGGKGLKAILGGLGELWDQSQYDNEYDLSRFLSKLEG